MWVLQLGENNEVGLLIQLLHVYDRGEWKSCSVKGKRFKKAQLWSNVERKYTTSLTLTFTFLWFGEPGVVTKIAFL